MSTSPRPRKNGGHQLVLARSAARSQTEPAPRTPRQLRIRSNGGQGTFTVTGEPLAAAARLENRREFVDRLFSITTLGAARIDPLRGSLWLSFDEADVTVPEALEALAAAMRAADPPRQDFRHEELIVTTLAYVPFTVWRAEGSLTLWRVEELHAGRFRLSHPLLRHPAIRDKVLDDLAAVADVTRQWAPFGRPESVEVRCHPHRVDGRALLEVVDAALANHAELLAEGLFPLRGQMVGANLVLAPISDFLFAPLGIANAVLIWLLNVGHVAPAWRGLRERRVNLEFLYLCIGACTLLTFHFFGSALMYAALEFWPRLVGRMRIDGRRQFLARYRRSPRSVWMEHDGALLETPSKQLRAGQVLFLREGDTAPGDGVVLEGRAAVRESWITGIGGSAEKKAGDALYASSELREGELRVRIDALRENTVAAKLAAWFGQTLRKSSPPTQSIRFAEAAILPVLVLGVAAFGRGGLHMTKAVLRPDYFSGASMAEELSELLAVIQAAEAGFYVADPRALDRLAQADCWIFDDSVPWRTTDGGRRFAEKLRAQGVREVFFVSARPEAGAAELATSLGFDVYHGSCSAEAAKSFIAHRQMIGQTVAYFGDGARWPAVFASADVAVSVSAGPQREAPATPIALFQPDLDRCGVLLSLSQARASAISDAFLTSVGPNLAAVAGAIYLEFSVLASVVLTNLGTLASYYRWRRTLQSAE